ncbi:hypothetical protein VTN00DRAFT_4689 [Thermoascus crustaceus]|uniref:uncharacterized protein n=1 Tax=Thermoascus crustaceus TaxID=5088 RepID=UPI0037439F9F
MPSYTLSIAIFGEGNNPTHRSHWAFTIHQSQPPQDDPTTTTTYGDLLHVRVIDLDRLWYQFEHRSDTHLPTMHNIMQAVGTCKIADLPTAEDRRRAIEIIAEEGEKRAPRDGGRRCQEWVFETLIALEVEEFVPEGTAGFWKGMVGREAREVEREVGVGGWVDLRRRIG